MIHDSDLQSIFTLYLLYVSVPMRLGASSACVGRGLSISRLISSAEDHQFSRVELR